MVVMGIAGEAGVLSETVNGVSGRGVFGVTIAGVMETRGVNGSELLVIGSETTDVGWGEEDVAPVESSIRALDTA